MRSPDNTGSLCYNYKGFFSIVLLAVCDANYCFTMFDLGQYGSNNDIGVLMNSELGKKLKQGALSIPQATFLDGCLYDPLPYFLVRDEIFSLKTYLMRPYPGSTLTEKKSVINYRHSRARRVIENSFGILVSRWRIFNTPFMQSQKRSKKLFWLSLRCIITCDKPTTQAIALKDILIVTGQREILFLDTGEMKSAHQKTTVWQMCLRSEDHAVVKTRCT